MSQVNQLTGNLPLREICERLHIQVARVVVKMMPDLGRAADWDAIGHIRRAHISTSFARMLQNARAKGAIPEEARAEP